jgi:multiple sugar transport system permease protein
VRNVGLGDAYDDARSEIASRAARGMSDITIRNLFIIPTIAVPDRLQHLPAALFAGLFVHRFPRLDQARPIRRASELPRAAQRPGIWSNFTITAKYVIVSVVGQVIVGFGVALLLNRDIPFKGLITTLLLLPMMLSMAVVGLFWKLLYDPSFGIINYALGLGKFEWLSNPTWRSMPSPSPTSGCGRPS